MARRILFALGATALAVFAIPAGPAVAGGGGCHGPATTGAGDAVEMVDACFTPTTLEVGVGDTVTFVNRDPMPHNVSAMGWGKLEPMAQGDWFTTTFAEAGVYPFACTYHTGMTGLIVVGDTTAGEGDQVALGAGSGSSPAAAVAATSSATDGRSVAGWLVPGAIGLLLGLGAGWFARRRDDRVVDPEPELAGS